MRIVTSAFLIRLLLNALAFILPVTQSIPVGVIKGRTVSIGLDTLILLGIYAMWWGGGARLPRMFGPRARMPAAGVLFMVAWYAFEMGIAVLYPRAEGQKYDAALMLMRWCQYVPLFFVLPSVQFSAKAIRTLAATITTSAVLISLINIVEYNIHDLNSTVGRGAIWVTESIFNESAGYNYNISGGYLMVAILLNVPRFTHATDGKRLIGAAAILVVLLGLIYNSSRSSLLGTLVGIATLIAGSAVRWRSKILLIGMTGALLAGVYLFQGEVFNSMRKLTDVSKAVPMLWGEDRSQLDMPEYVASSFERFRLWRETFEQIRESPIWGSGFASLRWRFAGDPLFTADSFYLELVADTGLIGLAFFVGMAAQLHVRQSALRRFRRTTSPETSNFVIGCRAAFWAILFINLTGNMFAAQTIWGMFVILSTLAFSAVRQPKRCAPDNPPRASGARQAFAVHVS